MTEVEWQAARVLTGVTMAGLIGARFFPSHAWTIRVGITALYIAGVLAFAAWGLLRP